MVLGETGVWVSDKTTPTAGKTVASPPVPTSELPVTVIRRHYSRRYLLLFVDFVPSFMKTNYKADRKIGNKELFLPCVIGFIGLGLV